MDLSLFDLHCDTASEMLHRKQGLESNGLAVSLDKAKVFSEYVQVMAHFTPPELSDEDGWAHFCQMSDHLKTDPAVLSGKASIVAAVNGDGAIPRLLLSVEDARILANRLERVKLLYDRGIRIITPLWAGSTCIGGSHDTEEGLTAFGKAALTEAASMGILLDVSHASEASAETIFEISSKFCRPVIASHSNAHAICPVSRNLKDGQIRALLRSDGIIGLNLHRDFLCADGNARAESILPHVDHFLSLGAEKHLALGCDMDGCDLPPDIPDLSSLPHLAEVMLKNNYPEHFIFDVFYGNALRFFRKHLQ